MVQGFHPALSPLLQLPNITVAQSEELAKLGAVDFASFVKLDDIKRKQALADMSDKDYRQAVRVAENFPVLEVVDAKFQGLFHLERALYQILTFGLQLLERKSSLQDLSFS